MVDRQRPRASAVLRCRWRCPHCCASLTLVLAVLLTGCGGDNESVKPSSDAFDVPAGDDDLIQIEDVNHARFGVGGELFRVLSADLYDEFVGDLLGEGVHFNREVEIARIEGTEPALALAYRIKEPTYRWTLAMAVDAPIVEIQQILCRTAELDEAQREIEGCN